MGIKRINFAILGIFSIIIFGVSGLSQDAFAAGFDTPLALDTADRVGFYTSIAIGNDGFPVISYYDATNGDLKFIHCTATDCSTADTLALDTTDNVGKYTSIAIGNDGFPVISYYHDKPNGDLKFIHCTATDCSTTDTPLTLDTTTGSVGFYTSIAIGNDGFPVISYTHTTNGDLKFIHCTDTDCSTTDTPLTLDTAGSVGHYTSIAIGTDGLPVISYLDATNGDLKFVHCGDIDCAENTNSNTITTVDSTDNVGFYTSIAIGNDGFPVISYNDFTNGDLKFVRCGDIDCAENTNSNTITTVDSTDHVGFYTSIAIGNDGFPVISYRDSTNFDLKFVHCTDTDCSTTDTPITLDSTGFVGFDTSIAIGNDGFPVISYFDFTNDDLKFVHCTDIDCVNKKIEVDDCDDDQNIFPGDKLIMVGDIVDVAGDCISLDVDGITLDCKGHTIDGIDENDSHGIIISASGVTVKNCNVTDHGIGIYLLHAEESSITKNTLTSNFNGILLNRSDNNKITANSSTGNTNNGLFLVQSNSNQIQRNDFSDNMNFGILFSLSDDNVVNANNVDDNTEANMQLNTSDNNTIKRNTFNNGSDNGLDVSISSMGNNIISNTANDNAVTGFADDSSDSGTAGTANTYLRNSCSGNLNGSDPTGLCKPQQ